MNPERFFIPRYMGMRNIPMTNSMFNMTNTAPRGMGLFSRITNGIRSVNWSGLLTNANKTLDVVNQTIPLVRQAGPMFNNMKSMLRVAKAFGSETTSNKNGKINSNNMSNNINSNNYVSNNENISQKKETHDESAPNFFI